MTRPPDPRPPGTRLYAVTPSLGVRLWLERGPFVCLHAGNEGGRGRALGLVAVPLREVDGGLACTLDVAALDAADAAARRAFLDAHLRIRGRPDLLPFVECFTPAQWHAVAGSASLALVLLLFWQRDPRTHDGHPLAIAPGQGGSGATAAPAARRAPTTAAAFGWSEVWPAIRAAIARPGANWSRGLAHLDPADRPVVRGGARVGGGWGPGPDGGRSTSPFVFAVGSCQYPAGLVDATPAAPDDGPAGPPGPADASMIRLGELLRRFGDPGRPSLLVLAGDQVYVDETAGLFDPRAGAVPDPAAAGVIGDEWLRVPYQNWLGSVGAQSVLGLVPSRMMIDDHEIDDNWAHLAPNVAPQDQTLNEALRRAGLAAYGHWQRASPRARQWHRYAQRGVRFFMADTRTERAGRKARLDPLDPGTGPRIMGAAQERALLAWLAHPRDRPAFVVSPSMLLPRRRTSVRSTRGALHSDAWDGYPRSLHALLAAIWRLGRSDLVFLSGDEHLSSVTRITVTDLARTRSVTLHSIHSSGLYAPYPFANSVPEEFQSVDAWEFKDPDSPRTSYLCEVEVLCWVPGDGFAVLTLAEATPGRWDLRVRFDRGTGQDAAPALTLALSSRPHPPAP